MISIPLTYRLPMPAPTAWTAMKNLLLRFAATLGMAPETERLYRLFDAAVADHDTMIRRIVLHFVKIAHGRTGP